MEGWEAVYVKWARSIFILGKDLNERIGEPE